MKYTADKLDDMNVDTVTVYYRNGDFDYFYGVSFGLIDYLYNEYDDASVMVAPMYADGSIREDPSACYVEDFLEIINTPGNKVVFGEDRDVKTSLD